MKTTDPLGQSSSGDIRADLGQYYSMKAVFEQVLGKTSFMAVKDDGSLKSWKTETVRLLKAIALSVVTTVEVADEEWRREINAEIDHGISRVKAAAKIDELFAGLAATLATLTFLQIGFLPRGRGKVKRVALTAPNWKLNLIRSVQYVQSKEQREAQKRLQSVTVAHRTEP